MPQMMVSQSGMLSRLPGATNLPNTPMMIPAMMTPMISTVSSLKVMDGAGAKRVPDVGHDSALSTTEPP